MSGFSKGFDQLADLLGNARAQKNKTDETNGGGSTASDKNKAATAKPNKVSDLSSLVQVTAETNADFKVRKIALKDIEVRPQVRTEFDFVELEALAKSIEDTGLKEPLTVAEKNEAGKYRLVNGERRFRAFNQIKGVTPDTRVDCIIDKRGYKDETHLYETQIIDNVQRQDLSKLELAKGLKHLQDSDPKKYTQAELAKLCGKKASQISDLFTLLDANEDTAKLIELTSDPQALAKIIRIQDDFPKEVRDFCEKAEAEGKTSRGKIEDFVKALTEDPDREEFIPDVATEAEIQAAREERDAEEEKKTGKDKEGQKKKYKVKEFIKFTPESGTLLLALENGRTIEVFPNELIANIVLK
jgi:ParB/RepB/Spo0J family partition protein